MRCRVVCNFLIRYRYTMLCHVVCDLLIRDRYTMLCRVVCNFPIRDRYIYSSLSCLQFPYPRQIYHSMSCFLQFPYSRQVFFYMQGNRKVMKTRLLSFKTTSNIFYFLKIFILLFFYSKLSKLYSGINFHLRMLQRSFENVTFLTGWRTKWRIPTQHYENTPIQIYWKFHHQKLKVFKSYYIFHISAPNIDWGYSLEPPRRF